MKNIYLVRHAKAVGYGSEILDIERALAKRGKNDAEKLAKQFKADIGSPNLIISSTAKRAIQTAEIFARKLGYKTKKIMMDSTFYELGQEDFLKTVKALAPQVDSVMIIGHNPTLEDFAAGMLKDFGKEMPTSCIAGISYDTDSWANIVRGRGQLSYYNHPRYKREITREKKETRKALSERITGTLTIALKKVDPQIESHDNDYIEKASRSVARSFMKRTAMTTDAILKKVSAPVRRAAPAAAKAPAKPKPATSRKSDDSSSSGSKK